MTSRAALPLILPWILSCASAPATPPPTAVLYVVDKSGSMAGNAINDLKEGCLAGVRVLDPSDYVGVLAFGTRPLWIVPFTHPRDDGKLAPLRRLLADGGSDLYAALHLALRAFQALPAEPPLKKRLVIISDGNTREVDYRTIVQELVQHGVSISTVCVGTPMFDAVRMSELATWGHGRFIFTNISAHVPRLMEQETRQLKAE